MNDFKYIAIAPQGVYKKYKRMPSIMNSRLVYCDAQGREIDRIVCTSVTFGDGTTVDASDAAQYDTKVYNESRLKAIQLGYLKE